MERNRAYAAVGLLTTALLQACSDAKSPVQPMPPPVPTPEFVFGLSGYVSDSASRRLGGAKVEVSAGPRVGTIATTDDTGRFSMSGTFTGPMTVTAAKDGYVSRARTIPFPGFPPRDAGAGGGTLELAFSLELVGPKANITGQYTVTLTADRAACHFPDEARTRTYNATIVQGDRSSAFVARLSDARFYSTVPCPVGLPPEFCTYNRVGIGTAGDYAAIYAGVIERLGETTYLAVTAGAEGSFSPTGIAAPLKGSFLYCHSEPYLIDQGTWWCEGGEYWESDHHQIAIVRR